MVEDCTVSCLAPVNTLVYFDLQGCQASFHFVKSGAFFDESAVDVVAC